MMWGTAPIWRWAAAFIFFVITGPMLVPIFFAGTFFSRRATADNGSTQQADQVASLGPTPAALLVMVFAPYLLWCLYFAVRSWWRPVGLLEHFLILVLFTPIIAVLCSVAVFSFVEERTGIVEEPFFVLVWPIIYGWQFVQYLAVQFLDQKWSRRVVSP